MSLEQKPCPLCGGENISAGEVATTLGGIRNITQSECQDCGALGPWADLGPTGVDYGDVKAIAAWNHRPVAQGETK